MCVGGGGGLRRGQDYVTILSIIRITFANEISEEHRCQDIEAPSALYPQLQNQRTIGPVNAHLIS